MRMSIFYTTKHNSYWRNKAFRLNPWAHAALPVPGAYFLFVSQSDLIEFKTQNKLPL